MRKPRILIFPGSTRTGSHNGRLAGVITKTLALRECEVMRISLVDYSMPIYNGDDEARDGPPAAAQRLARLFHCHDSLVIVSPEYNASIPPLLKNTIDWVSRVKFDSNGPVIPYRNKVIALASASPGRFGGMRSLVHLRASLISTGALVLSEQLSVGNAASAFDDSEQLIDERARAMLDALCDSVIEKASVLPAQV